MLILIRSNQMAGIIRTHGIYLYGKTKNFNIRLCPLNDGHLPVLYKWNADPDVTYWCESDDSGNGNDEQTTRDIYEYVSNIAYCFLIEADGVPVGECWLEEMNIKEVSDMYPGRVVKRIDLMIGEKDYWGRGIGSAVIGMLTDYAFMTDGVDILHIPCVFDFNVRSQRAFLRNGYKFVKAVDIAGNAKMKQEYHYAIARDEWTPCHDLTYERAFG